MQSLQLFGTPQLLVDGVTVSKLRPKSLLFLAFLAVEQSSYTRSRLVDLFWPTQSEQKGRRNLSWTLNNIKKCVGVWVTLHGDSIAIAPEMLARVDVLQFDKLAESVAVSDLRQAETLYQGRFLAGLEIDDLPELENWQSEQVTYWERRVHELLYRLANALAYGNQLGEAIKVAQRRLKLDDWHEPAHRHLIELYSQAGRYDAALTQYELCRKLLVEGLGSELSEATESLVETVRAQLQQQRQLGQRGNLPGHAPLFFGRKFQFQSLITLLQQPTPQLITLTGMGGSGKTTFAQAIGYAVIEQFFDGVWFVPLASVAADAADMIGAVADTIASALRLPQDTNVDSLTRLLHYFKQKSALLILDNFEYLHPASPLITQMLQSLPQLKILVTSRVPLGLKNEHVETLTGLALQGENSPAMQLLRERLPDERQAGDSAELQQLLSLTAGLPLAIELCATALAYSSPRHLIALLQEDVGVLSSHWRDIAPRHRSLTRLFEQTWGALSPSLQEKMGALALFSADFDTLAACQITGITLSELRQLVQHALLHLSEQQYQIHPLLSQWIRSLPTQNHARYAQEHAAYYLNFAAQQLPDMRRGKREAMTRAIGNVRQAWRWAVGNGADALQLLAADALVEYALGDTNLSHTMTLFEEGIAATETVAVRHVLLNRIGLLKQALRSSVDDERLEAMIGVGEDSAEIALTHYLLGNIATRQNNHAYAVSKFGQAFAIFERCAERRGMVLALRAQAAALLFTQPRDFDLSWQYLTRSLRLAYQLGESAQIAHTLKWMGNWATLKEDRELAVNSFEEALALFRKIGHLPSIIDNLQNRGSLAYKWGDLADAERMMSEALLLARRAGLRKHTTQALANLGEVRVMRGQRESGWQLVREALLYAVIDDDRKAQQWLCVIMGRCLGESADSQQQQFAADLFATVLHTENVYPFILETVQNFAANLPVRGQPQSILRLIDQLLSPQLKHLPL